MENNQKTQKYIYNDASYNKTVTYCFFSGLYICVHTRGETCIYHSHHRMWGARKVLLMWWLVALLQATPTPIAHRCKLMMEFEATGCCNDDDQ